MDAWQEAFDARRKARADAAENIVVDGITLTVKPGVAPETIMRFQQGRAGLIAHAVAVQEAIKAEQEPPAWPVELQDEAMIGLIEDTAEAVLHPSSLAGWRQLRDPGAAVPLTFPDIFTLLNGLIDKASGFPTEEPSVSETGPDTTEPSSTEPSSSTEETSAG